MGIFYFFGCVIDILISYTVYKYSPAFFLRYEANIFAVDFLRGNTAFGVMLLIFMLIPPSIVYIAYRYYLYKKGYVPYVMQLYAYTLYAGFALHVFGGLSWLLQ